MKEFLKPTKITLIAFTVFLVLNLALFLFGLLLWNLGVYKWSFFLIPLSQTAWLWSLFREIGIDVTGRGDIVADPNFLGWVLILVGSLITLTIYYLLASAISKYLCRKKSTGTEINKDSLFRKIQLRDLFRV